MKITPPLLTQALMAIPPIAMVGVAIVVSLGLILAHKFLEPSRFGSTAWFTTAIAAGATLVGVLAFLSPLYSIVVAAQM